MKIRNINFLDQFINTQKQFIKYFRSHEIEILQVQFIDCDSPPNECLNFSTASFQDF